MTPLEASSANPFQSLIPEILQRLRQLCQKDVQTQWRVWPGALDNPAEVRHLGPTWPLADLNDRGHIAWPQGKQVLWLYQRFQWPTHLQGFPIAGMQARLALRWWADQAEIYVNGQFVQAGDLFDCFTRLPLDGVILPGQGVEVALRLSSPGHDRGALVRSHLILEAAPGDFPEPGFVADELAVLQRYLQQFNPDQLPLLAAQLATIDWAAVGDRRQFQASLARVREHLQPLAAPLKQRHIYCIGHAHLDLAWLWPVEETWRAAERTFQSVLSLQVAFPHLTYTHSSPALFAWLETHRPDLFTAIQAQVKQGKWAIDAGLWVEPELNLSGGEAIARQLLYGQRYCQEKFGQISPIAWLPDSFGFCGQLPQILLQGGVRYFATQKLRWNDTHPFPYDLFWWQGLDGSRILSLNLPLIGTDIAPLEMAEYACQWEAQTGIPESLWLPGVGDHGGGPTRDMLEKAERWASSPFFPQLSFGHVVPFLQKWEPLTSPPLSSLPSPPAAPSPVTASLPVWRDELYLEFHRGCYTTHADQKWYNRRCEDLLYQAELMSSLAALVAHRPYPHRALEAAWKQVLFNQFHDILPGSSIPEVFATANQGWKAAISTGSELLHQALGAIATAIAYPQPPHPDARPVLVFNPLNWGRSELVTLDFPASLNPHQGWQIVDSAGVSLPTQWIHDPLPAPYQAYPPQPPSQPQLLFQASDLPGVGYRLFWLVPDPSGPDHPPELAPDRAPWILENENLRVCINPQTGNLDSLYDQQQAREILNGPGNELRAYTDQGQYWDAWNIAPDYREHPQPGAVLQAISWIERGPLRQRLRVVRSLAGSLFQQDYCLEVSSRLLKIATTVDWQASHTLVKAAFPLTWEADDATYEIPFGSIRRATHPRTSQDAAKWEVPALCWADISEPSYGLSLLTDSKHGFDAQPNELRLTLLKAAQWPDPQADRGTHFFTVALYPHPQTSAIAGSAHHARALNIPCLTWVGMNPDLPSEFGELPEEHSFLNLAPHNPSDSPPPILSAFKPAESDPDHWILRCYEPQGETHSLTLHTTLPLEVESMVNILEENQQEHDGLEKNSLEKNSPEKNSQQNQTPADVAPAHEPPPAITLHPWQVLTLKLRGCLKSVRRLKP